MTRTDPGLPRAARRAGVLTLVVGLAGTSAAGAAWLLSGPNAAMQAAIAAALCLTPGWLVFTFAGLYGTAAPLGTVIVGTIIRMAAVVVGVLAIKVSRPDLANLSFAVWLGVFYVLALATETKLLLTPPPRGTSSED